jgi:hypothetical protein
MIRYPGGKRITVRLSDGTDNHMVVSLIKLVTDSNGNAVIAQFGRDDGNGWREFLAAPLTSIVCWD